MPIVPKVSVLIPAYNYAHMLDDAIQSVLSQTFEDFELIIVDNCSQDNTTQVVSKYLADKRVFYYKNESNIGLSGNWNKCLQLANGEYIKYLCADDKLHPQTLERYLQLMEENSSISLVTCSKQEFTKEGIYGRISVQPFKGLIDGNKVIRYILTQHKNIIGSPTRVMFRKSNLPVGYFSNYNFITDLEMWLRHLCIGNCYFISDVLAYGRIHEGQQQIKAKKYSQDHIEYYQLFKRVWKGFYPVDKNIVDDDLIKKSIKHVAIKCAFYFYKLLSKVTKKSYRKSIQSLFLIGFREQVLLHPSLLKIYSKKIKESKILIVDKNKNFTINKQIVALNDSDR